MLIRPDRVLVDASNPDDRAMAEDLIVGAINAALQKARERAAEEMARGSGNEHSASARALGSLLGEPLAAYTLTFSDFKV